MIRVSEQARMSDFSGTGVNFCTEVQQHYRALLRRLGWPILEEGAPLQTLGITSCFHGEGVSTVAAQLAATAATTPDQRILLVDAHLQKSAAANSFGFAPQAGFADAIRASTNDALEICSTRIPNLSLITAGIGQDNADHVYDSPALSAFVAELKSEFDLIVFDLPPCGGAHAPLRLAKQLDGVLLVVEAERVRQQDAHRVRQLLDQARVRLLGAVLNRQRIRG
jgi:capsular exopolysaccharide synthesis family protein